MFITKIKYEDFNGNQCEEEACFYLNEAEITNLKIFNDSDELESVRQRIVNGETKSEDMLKMMDAIKELILKSYGIKSEDGKHFRKSEEISKDFEQSAAFPALFMDIYNDQTGDKVQNFIKGVMPKSLLNKINSNELAALTNNLK